MRALRALGHEVTFVPREGGFSRESSLYRRIRHRLRIPCETSGENGRLLEAATAARPALVWIEKGTTLWPATLRRFQTLPSLPKIVSFSADDMMNPTNQSWYWRRGFKLYDVHVTTKTHNIEEFIELGARGVVFMAKSYDPETHRPMTLSAEEHARFESCVAFIGYYERERFQSLCALAAVGIPVRVWGDGWAEITAPSACLQLERHAVHGEDYARALNATKIALCFLRKVNRDRQTARSVEIPACGVFMLGERSDEHEALFREGIEAEYFGSDGELVEKARRYLADETARRRMALAGRARCVSGKFSHAERLSVAVEACLAPAAGVRRQVPVSEVGRVW